MYQRFTFLPRNIATLYIIMIRYARAVGGGAVPTFQHFQQFPTATAKAAVGGIVWVARWPAHDRVDIEVDPHINLVDIEDSAIIDQVAAIEASHDALDTLRGVVDVLEWLADQAESADSERSEA
jgi:hypothetical protein